MTLEKREKIAAHRCVVCSEQYKQRGSKTINIGQRHPRRLRLALRQDELQNFSYSDAYDACVLVYRSTTAVLVPVLVGPYCNV